MESLPHSPTPMMMSHHEHIVVVPYPSCGHINPMMHLSTSIVSINPNIHITFVVTQQWFPSITKQHRNNNIRICSIPDLVSNEPSSSSDNFNSTVEAVMTKMEPALEKLLNEIEQPPTAIIYDGFLYWAVAVGNRRNIPVAAFWTTTAAELWVQCFNLLHQYDEHHQKVLGENGDKVVDYIPGVSWIRLADNPLLHKNSQKLLHWAMKSCEWMLKSHCILLPTFYDLECKVIDAMRVKTSVPIYTVGPNIPYLNIEDNNSSRSDVDHGHTYYLTWLDAQPSDSVLYISFGSFLSVSSAQMDEIASALKNSGVRFLWVIRGVEEAYRIKENFGNNNNMGLVVPWCDQLKVLLHGSIGGYWTHCGWNSIMEGVYGGVPFLTFPIAMDQALISKMVVEDWMVGWRVKKDDKSDGLVTRDEIVVLLMKFMKLDSEGIRKRAKELKRMCHLAIAKDGSSQINIKAFLKNITPSVVSKP